MLTVPEPSLGILAGCLPVCVPLFAKFGRLSSALKSSFNRRSNASGSQSGSDDNTKLCTGTYPNTKTKKSFISFSWNSRSRSSKSRTDVDAEAALGLPAYPATSVIVSRASSEDDYLPGICPEQIRATEEMMRLNGGSWNGITVLREVVVERERA